LYIAACDGGTSEEEEKESDNPKTAATASTQKKIVISVLLLLDATVLVNRTTRWSSPFSRSTPMKKKKKNAIAWNTMSVKLLWKKSVQKMTMHHVKCTVR
jgi:hypothetical protein